MALLNLQTDPNRNKQRTNALIQDPNRNKQTTNTLVPDTEIKPTDWVQMWTGQGYASVNPSAVQKKLAQGWSMSGPSQAQIGELVNIAQQGGQGVYDNGIIKALEGSVTTQTPTSKTTNTYVNPTNYQSMQVGGGQVSNQQTRPSTQGYASNISDQYKAQTDILLNQLRQKIAESKAQQESIKSNAPKQFDPLRSQSELSKAQELRSVLERNSLLGDRGGVGRSAALQTQTAGENRLNAINLQQQSVIDNANQQIAQLESQGRFEEANILATQKLAELQALMSEQQRMDEIARQDRLTSDELARQTTQEQRQAELDTLSRYSSNYQAEINRRQQTPDTADDWLIPYLQTARQEKIDTRNLDPTTGRPIQTGPTQDQWDNAYKKWNSGIPLTQQEMQILGTNVAVQPKSTSGGSQRTTTVTQDRSFQEDRWKRLGKADEQVAATWGVPVGTPYNSQITQEPADITPYQNFIENNFVTKATDMSPRTVNRMGITRYIYGLIEDNKFAEADLLASIYGITDSEFDAIEASLGNQRR